MKHHLGIWRSRFLNRRPRTDEAFFRLRSSVHIFTEMNGHSDVEGIGLGLVAPPSSTGIKVIVVGSGFAGLACAIECKRKGHNVLVLEKFSELKVLGELDHSIPE
jgi:hypothetical protein